MLVILCFISCNNNTNYFNAIAKNDIPLKKPQKGDWLFSHKERMLTLGDYQKTYPLTPDGTRHTIYLKPIGDFSGLEWKQIELTRQYLENFFQIKTRIQQSSNNKIIPLGARRINQHHEQLLATYLRDTIIAVQKPKDAIVMMGIIEMDLYPSEKWNFVFGLASYDKGLAVGSIYRFHQRPLTPKQFNLSLQRLLKTSSHEIGHMFGLTHCIEANCLMNGTNSLAETDRSIARLCSGCQQKLNSTLKYDNKKRLQDLSVFFSKNKIENELALINADIVISE
ncbi:archaemetzincin [Pedobacter sp. AK013]|uniref:archaemetzincin n=1 Tax=Pedobacter sp. AK013 TaxID=2723071 RepID=UPI0017AB6518|nr:archaemetzincin [Pedobacter sp. AK013]MBB6239762.1 archaemetzincin [Pedobacter sp. AK013]